MAGKIIADTIESAGSQISLNVGNVTILTASSSGLTLTPTNNVNINVTNSTLAFGAGNVSFPSITTSGDTNTGLYFPAADTIAFTEGGVESMRINSSGNLGIGTASPSYKLHVSSSSNRAYISSESTATTAGPEAGYRYKTVNQEYLNFCDYDTQALRWYDLTAASERMRLTSTGKLGIGNSSPDAQLLHVGSGAGGGSINGYTRLAIEASDYAVTTIKAPAANFSQIIFADPTSSNLGGINFFNSSHSTPNAMAFLTGVGSEGMRIDQFRNVLFNCSTLPGSNDAVYAKIIKGSGEDNVMRSHVGVSGSKPHFYFFNTNGLVGNISTSASATTYNTSSDYRLKENIAPMTGALAKVNLLKPCTYKWKVDGSDGQGFIAHELAEVCPHAVTGEKDAVDADGNPQHQGVDVSFLVATLTAAIQELKVIVDAQAVEIAALKAK